jgi:predicted phage tail protein
MLQKLFRSGRISFLIGLLLLLVFSQTFFAFTSRAVLDDFWQTLGVGKEKGTNSLKQSFLSGYFAYYGAAKVKSLAAADRAAVAKDLMEYAKQYFSSAAFEQEYQKIRSAAKPQASSRKMKSKEEIRAERIAETEKGIRETEENLKKMSADLAKSIRPVLDMLKANLKEYKDPNSQMIEMMHQGEVMNFEAEEKNHQRRLTEWEQEYPADSKAIIRKRLQHFIDVASTVDFSAELKTVGDKKKFVKAAYEGKSTEWKQIFRAGKEVIHPAVAFARQWLAEMK